MRRNSYIGMLCMSVGLFGIVFGVSSFISVLVAGVIGVILRTDSDWVFIWVGAPLSVILAVYWVVKNWEYVKAFVTGRAGW